MPSFFVMTQNRGFYFLVHTFFADDFQNWDFRGFAIKRRAAKLRLARGGAQRPVLHSNMPKKTVARSAAKTH